MNITEKIASRHVKAKYIFVHDDPIGFLNKKIGELSADIKRHLYTFAKAMEALDYNDTEVKANESYGLALQLDESVGDLINKFTEESSEGGAESEEATDPEDQ